MDVLKLPSPQPEGSLSLESALAQRRSLREFDQRELTLGEIGQILWAAQGITDYLEGRRTAPSAGALYPLEVYLANSQGVFHYRPINHLLVQTMGADVRRQLRQTTPEQGWVELEFRLMLNK